MRTWAARPAVITAAAAAVFAAACAARFLCAFFYAPAYNKMYSESLVRFRYAEMIMDGEPLPAVDPMVQWPEGFPRDRMDMVYPDYLTGWTYRAWAALAGGVDHYTFLRWFMAFYAVLYVPAAFLFFLAAFRRRWPALAATLLYVTCLPTFWRAAGTYLREDFATPPLILATAAGWWFLRGGEASRRARAWMVAGLAAATLWAMSSWHMAQFYLNLILGITFLIALAGRRGRFGDAGLGLLLGTAAAALLNKPLWVKGVMWSPTAAAALALAVWGYWRGPKEKWLGRLALLAGAAVLVGLSLLKAGSGAYGHAYALIWSKIRFVGIRPADPAQLPLDARIFWMGPYQTTTAQRALMEYALLLPLAVGAFVWGLLRARAPRDERWRWEAFPAVMTLATGVLYWLIVRLTIFFAPWAALAAVAPVVWARTARARIIAGTLLAAVAAFQVFWITNLPNPTPPRLWLEKLPKPAEPVWDYGAGDNDAFLWLGSHTAPGAAVLTQFGVSASVMYWAHRPVALHPMFEVPEIRPKIVATAKTFMASEEALYTLCRQWRISYVIFNAPIFLIYEPPGDRYFAMAPAPASDAVGMKMQFAPETLTRFRLVKETYVFRIYEVGKSYDGYRARRYHPYFDKAVFPALPDRNAFYEEVGRIKLAGEHYKLAVVYQSRGWWRSAAAEYGRVLDLHPDYEDAEMRLGYCLVQSNQLEAAEVHFRRAVATDPENALAHTYMGSYFLSAGAYEAALAEYRRAAELAPGDAAARERIRYLESMKAGN